MGFKHKHSNNEIGLINKKKLTFLWFWSLKNGSERILDQHSWVHEIKIQKNSKLAEKAENSSKTE